MKQMVSFDMFLDSFRVLRPDNFSRDGLKALFEYFEQVEQDTGEDIDLDVIAVCCEYTEYDNAIAGAEGYGFETEPYFCEDCECQTDPLLDTCQHCGEGICTTDWLEHWETQAREYLETHTLVLLADNGHVIVLDY